MSELLEGTTLTPEQLQYLSICHANGDALIALINDIVDISRIEAGELQLDRITFDLEELLSGVAEAVALRFPRDPQNQGEPFAFKENGGTGLLKVGF